MWILLILLIVILFIMITSRVIAKSRRSVDALRVIRERLEAVTQTIGVGLAIISKDHRTLWANRVLKNMAGDVEGVRCYYTFFQRNEICPGCGLQKVIKEGMDKVEHEVEGKDPEGNRIWSQVITTPIKDAMGNVTSVLEMIIPITERKKAEQERERLIVELEKALDEVKTLSGMLPICASCKKIRDDQGYWNQIEAYIAKRTDAKFTHGICPDCKRELYPELFGEDSK
jgi:PAS domain S-box-containing protein